MNQDPPIATTDEFFNGIGTKPTSIAEPYDDAGAAPSMAGGLCAPISRLEADRFQLNRIKL